MAVGPFLNCDNWKDLFDGTVAFGADGVAAVLVTDTHTPDRSADLTYAQISANECADGDYAAQALASKAVTLETGKIRFDCGKITFTASGSISGRYLYLVVGTAGSLVSTDKILGYIDLTGSGNASSVNAEFSFDPHANGLFEINQSAAA